MADFNEKVKDLTNTADTTAEYDEQDINNNKIYAILAYLGILVLVPIFAAKESKFARFHANQGLVLLICAVVVEVALSILSLIPYVGIVFSILSWIVSVVIFIFCILGIVNAAQGKAKELPIIGKFKLLK